MEKKKLPSGTWVTFRGLAKETTVEDIQAAFLNRTGIAIPENCIDVQVTTYHSTYAVMSLPHVLVREILRWALQDDTVHERRLIADVPTNQEAFLFEGSHNR